MFSITIDTGDRIVTISDEDLTDAPLDKLIPTIQEMLLALGYHPNCVSDAFSEEYNLWLSDSNPEKSS